LLFLIFSWRSQHLMTVCSQTVLQTHLLTYMYSLMTAMVHKLNVLPTPMMPYKPTRCWSPRCFASAWPKLILACDVKSRGLLQTDRQAEGQTSQPGYILRFRLYRCRCKKTFCHTEHHTWDWQALSSNFLKVSASWGRSSASSAMPEYSRLVSAELWTMDLFTSGGWPRWIRSSKIRVGVRLRHGSWPAHANVQISM